MSFSNRLREQIDACRSGSGDLALPALAELAEAVKHNASVADELARSHRFDEQLSAALHDVPVPTGLDQRLLATLQAQAPLAAVELEPAHAERRETNSRRIRPLRRQWLVAAGAIALTALVAVFTYQVWHRQQRLVASGELGGVVTTWLGQLPPNKWQSGRLPKDFTIDSAVIVGPSLAWQRFVSASPSGWSANVTAIDLTPPAAGQRRAILFVVQSAAKFSVPTRPVTTTRLALSRGFTGTAWQRQDSNLLFVLVVENQRLEDFLRQQPAA